MRLRGHRTTVGTPALVLAALPGVAALALALHGGTVRGRALLG